MLEKTLKRYSYIFDRFAEFAESCAFIEGRRLQYAPNSWSVHIAGFSAVYRTYAEVDGQLWRLRA